MAEAPLFSPHRAVRGGLSTVSQPPSVAGLHAKTAIVREKPSRAQSRTLLPPSLFTNYTTTRYPVVVRPPPLPRQLDVLSGVLAAIEHWDGVRPPAVVFDLDATLFDTRPRTLEILLEYGELVGEGAPELGVEVEPAGAEAAALEHVIEGDRELRDVVRELIGVPAESIVPPVGVDPRNPDFIALAQAFGCAASRPDGPESFGQAVKKALGANGPTLIEIRQDDAWLE